MRFRQYNIRKFRQFHHSFTKTMAALCTPCIRSTDSSLLTCAKHSSTSFKSILRQRLFKKSSIRNKPQSPIPRPIKKQDSNRRFQRIQGSHFVQEINPNNETINLSKNYDMTVFHEDELDDTQVALSHRRSKKIPRWARKSQLQLAIINQIYYNDQNPEEIFGTVRLDLAREMIDSIELWNTELPFLQSYANLPPNFV